MLILEKWNQWKENRGEKEDFTLFLDDWALEGTLGGVDLIYQLYLMQVCVEGLLEDVDVLSDLVIRLKDQVTGKPKPKKNKKEII